MTDQLTEAVASVSIPADVAVHDAVLRVQKYDGDPFAVGALGPTLAEIAEKCGVGLRVYCKIARAAAEDMYIVAGGIGDTMTRFIERCQAHEGLIQGDSALEVRHDSAAELQ